MVNLQVVGSFAQTFYDLFYYAVVLLAVGLVVGFISIAIYYYLQITRFDVEVYIKRRGIPQYLRDRLRYVKTEDGGEVGKLLKVKAIIHPEKVRPFIKFLPGKKKPVVFLYTEDMKEFYPMMEEVEKVKRKVKVNGGEKEVEIEGVKVSNIIPINDKLVRQFGYEEIKKAMDRSKIENPLKPVLKYAGYAMIGVFVLLALMIITNSLKDFSSKMVDVSKENMKYAKEMLAKQQYLYNITQQMLRQQEVYTREIGRLVDSVSDLVLQVREEQKVFREWLEKYGNQTKGG